MNNVRLARAAATLRDQVLDAKPKTKVELGEPDGLNVIREIIFSKAAATWLAPILEAVADPRIQWFETTEGGRLWVVFVPTSKADDSAKFAIDAADRVLRGD